MSESLTSKTWANSIDDNIEIVRDFVKFAYEQGMHELGYEPFEELLEQLRSAVPPSSALRDVIAERERQQSVEGWTPEHDDEHDEGQIAGAAASYAMHAADVICPASQGDGGWSESPPEFWPWDAKWWKPSGSGTNQAGARRDLVKAGALILAEIERIDRQASTKDERPRNTFLSPEVVSDAIKRAYDASHPVETSAVLDCPRCGGVGRITSSAYLNGIADCMLCKGIGRVVQIGENRYRPAESENAHL